MSCRKHNQQNPGCGKFYKKSLVSLAYKYIERKRKGEKEPIDEKKLETYQ